MLFDIEPAPRLVGIAKLASESERLEAKSQVEYLEIAARSVLNRCKAGMPFTWTINPYRGCEFGCKYCYARYTHEFMERDVEEFENRIYAKAAVAEILKRELAKTDKREAIAIGTATDSNRLPLVGLRELSLQNLRYSRLRVDAVLEFLHVPLHELVRVAGVTVFTSELAPAIRI